MKNKAIKNKYDFVMFFDVKNSVSDNDVIDREWILQKIRMYVENVKKSVDRYEIYTKEKHLDKMEKTYKSLAAKSRLNKRQRITPERQLQKWMCKSYFDVRAFGMNIIVGDNPGGMLRGPVHLGAITCDNQNNTDRSPYILYRIEGSVSAALAGKTGFSNDDLELFWQAFENMFKHDNGAAAEQNIAFRKFIIFKHKDSLGNAHSNQLFERVKITRTKAAIDTAKEHSDYGIDIEYGHLPANLEVCER